MGSTTIVSVLICLTNPVPHHNLRTTLGSSFYRSVHRYGETDNEPDIPYVIWFPFLATHKYDIENIG